MITKEDLLTKIKAEAPAVEVENQALGIPKTKLWVVEGDVGLTELDVVAYAAKRVELAERLTKEPGYEKQGLLAIEREGKILRWRPGKVLTYCVWRPSFQSDLEHEQTVEYMQLATEDWEGICGVKFEHVADKDHDDSMTLGDVSFPVLRQRGGGSTIAMAFFPDKPSNRRVVWVFDGFYDERLGFSPQGVLRHELGHVLGFRHEHIRPEAPDLFRPESLEHTVDITQYDPKSVMHYVAGNVGDPNLEFTDIDKQGALAIYGPSLRRFSFVE